MGTFPTLGDVAAAADEDLGSSRRLAVDQDHCPFGGAVALLEDGPAVVTGGAEGIGLAVAEALRSDAALVAVLGLDADRAAEPATSVGGTGPACDVTWLGVREATAATCETGPGSIGDDSSTRGTFGNQGQTNDSPANASGAVLEVGGGRLM